MKHIHFSHEPSGAVIIATNDDEIAEKLCAALGPQLNVKLTPYHLSSESRIKLGQHKDEVLIEQIISNTLESSSIEALRPTPGVWQWDF